MLMQIYDAICHQLSLGFNVIQFYLADVFVVSGIKSSWQITTLSAFHHVHGLIPERHNSSVLAVDLRHSCINP